MQTWQRAVAGALLVGAVAAAGIALNFTLLRLTRDANDPVGKLSPRAVFIDPARSTSTPTTTTTTTGTTGGRDTFPSGGGKSPDDGDGDD